MSQSNQLLDKDFVFRGECRVAIPLGDGELIFGETEAVNARFTMEDDTLEHVIMGQSQVVDREVSKVSATVQFSLKEIMGPLAQDLFVGQGLAQTLDTSPRMRRTANILRLKQTEKYYNITPYGLPQVFSEVFPVATGVTPAGAGTGTFADGAYHVWVVPVYADADEHRGLSLALPFSTTQLRGRQFVYGTPSASAPVTISSGPKGMTVSWTPPVPTASQPRWTHFAVVISALAGADDITDSGAKVAALVAGGLSAATIAGAGTDVFGAVPSLADLANLEYISIVSSTRTYNTLTSGTDYAWDKTTGAIALTTSGAESHSGKGFRVNTWAVFAPSIVQPFGAAASNERLLPVRLYNLHGDSANANIWRPVGGIIDFWELDFSRLPDDLLTAPGRRFHTAKQVTLPANFNLTKGAIGSFTAFSPEFKNALNFYGSGISAGV